VLYPPLSILFSSFLLAWFDNVHLYVAFVYLFWLLFCFCYCYCFVVCYCYCLFFAIAFLLFYCYCFFAFLLLFLLLLFLLLLLVFRVFAFCLKSTFVNWPFLRNGGKLINMSSEKILKGKFGKKFRLNMLF
jgi:hypothetical protein